MKPSVALEILRVEHEPYVPKIVSVIENGVVRDPSFEEQCETPVWCDGCNRDAKLCSVKTILDLIEPEESVKVDFKIVFLVGAILIGIFQLGRAFPKI